MVNTFPVIPGFLSLLALAFGYEEFTCRQECFAVKVETIHASTVADINRTVTVEENIKSNMADFLYTAPCPPIWNFTLACNYFSRKTISCEESTAILKRCLDHYDPYIPCNTTIDVIEQCMSENTTVCQSLIDLYNNYCNDTCRSHCDQDKHVYMKDTSSRVKLTHVTRGVISEAVQPVGNTDSDTVVDYFSGNHFLNISDPNNTHIKVIRVNDVRASHHPWTCGLLCIILLIGGFFLLVALLGCILFCVIRRFHKDDKSYRVHSKDKCVGPDDSGIRADSALLPGLHVKEEHHHIPRRYRNIGVQDTSFIHIHHYSNGTQRLLRGPLPGIDMEERDV